MAIEPGANQQYLAQIDAVHKLNQAIVDFVAFEDSLKNARDSTILAGFNQAANNLQAALASTATAKTYLLSAKAALGAANPGQPLLLLKIPNADGLEEAKDNNHNHNNNNNNNNNDKDNKRGGGRSNISHKYREEDYDKDYKGGGRSNHKHRNRNHEDYGDR